MEDRLSGQSGEEGRVRIRNAGSSENFYHGDRFGRLINVRLGAVDYEGKTHGQRRNQKPITQTPEPCQMGRCGLCCGSAGCDCVGHNRGAGRL